MPQISAADLSDIDLSDPNVTDKYPMQAVVMASLARTMTLLSTDQIDYIILRVYVENQPDPYFSICTGVNERKDEALEGLRRMADAVEGAIAKHKGEMQ